MARAKVLSEVKWDRLSLQEIWTLIQGFSISKIDPSVEAVKSFLAAETENWKQITGS